MPLIALTATAMVLACIPNGAAVAAEISVPKVTATINSANSATTVEEGNGNYFVTLDQKTKDYLKTLTESGVLREISADDNGKMILVNTDEKYLKMTYGINDKFIAQLKAVIEYANSKGVLQGSQDQLNYSTSAQLNQSSSTSFDSNMVSPSVFLQTPRSISHSLILICIFL